MLARLFLLPLLMLSAAAFDAVPPDARIDDAVSGVLSTAEFPAGSPAIELATGVPSSPGASISQPRTPQHALQRHGLRIPGGSAGRALEPLESRANAARERAGFLSFHTATPPPPQG